MKPLEYYEGNARPAWQPVIKVDGTYDDMSSGYTFEVRISPSLSTTAVKTKTTGITGAPGGNVIVNWASTDFPSAGQYIALLTATRSLDSKAWTIERELIIKPRML